MNFKSLSKKINFPVISLAGFFVIVIWLQFVPLTNVLAYEYSAINAILQSLLGGLLTVYFLSGRQVKLLSILRENYKIYCLIFLVPLIISFANTLLFVGCPLDTGILFYFVLTLPSLMIGIFLGYFARNLSSRFAFLLFTILFLIILLLPLIEFYFNPQIYFYNPLLGYFPGNIYDENITIDLKLIIYRSINLLFFGLIAFISELKIISSRVPKTVFIFSIIGIAVLFSILKPEFTFATSLARLESELGKTAETKNFRIVFDSSIDNKKIENFAFQQEYYVTEIASQTGINFEEKITAIVFRDSKQKGELFGAEKADVAKPWLHQFYVEIDNFESSLKHELTHIFASKIGTTPFKVADNLNPAMIEGYAMAIENEYDGKDIHHLAALGFKDSLAPNIKYLFSGLNFFSNASSLSYIFAGSFIKYLIDEYGIEKVNRLYGNLDFESTIGIPLDSLASCYSSFLNSYPIEFNKFEANLYFGRLPLIKKICARYAARKSEEGWELYNKKYYSRSLDIFKKLWQYSGNYSSLMGLAYNLRELKRFDEAIEILEKNIPKFNGSSFYFNLQIALGDLLYLHDLEQRADSIYFSLIQMNPRIDYSNIALIRIEINTDTSYSIKEYIEGSSLTRFNILKSIFAKNNNAEYIPALVNLTKTLEKDYSDFIIQFDQFNFSFTKQDAFSANYLYNYALENSDYVRAQKFIKKAINIGTKSSDDIFEQNLKKVDWLIKNADDIAVKFDNTK